MNLDYSQLRDMDVGFTCSTSFLSKAIQWFEVKNSLGKDWFGHVLKILKQQKVPSHVFLFNQAVPGKFFAAEMIDRGISCDSSIRKRYLECKGQTLLGVKRFSCFDSPALRDSGKQLIYTLRENELKYGFEELLRQMGLKNVKNSSKTLICSGLVNKVYTDIAQCSFGTEPDPYTIWRDPRGVDVPCLIA